MKQIHIRDAVIEDAGLILGFIRELAEYEKALDQVTARPRDIEKSLFSADSTTRALICEVDGRAAGYAVYFLSYSTWLGAHGIYLEDLYITPKFRGSGAGKTLLKSLAQIAVKNHLPRFEWSVLDWNKPAIEFYESFGAKAQNEWIRYRLDGDALKKFAGLHQD